MDPFSIIIYIFKIELNNSNDLSKDPLKGYSVSFGNIPITLNEVKILVANYYSGDKVQRQNSNLLREPEYNDSSGFPNQHQSYYQYLIRASAIATSEEITKDDYTYTIMSYNQDGLLSFSNNTTHRGGIQKQYIDYNYLGSIKETLNIYVNGEEKVSERNIYEYDDLNRLIETKHQFNSNPITSLSQIKYDQIGREESVKRGNNDKLTTSYKYNRVSQVTNITTPKLFQQEVNYWQMTGNVIQVKYGTLSANETTIDYEYDNLHRLLKATKNKLPLSEYKYDKNGNILKTLNYQSLDNKSNELIDNLAFTYQGNQLTNISESVKAVNTKTFDFKDYSGGKGEMKYNLNGALYSDSHKKIKEILYNSQNLPVRLSVEGHPLVAGDIKYVYSAAGEKLQTVHSENKDLRNSPIIGTASYATVNPVVTTTDYVGNKIYEKVDNGESVLKRVLIHGGYIDFINNNINNPRYNFYIADHLGNNRVVVNNEGNVLQRTNFYPFGMTAAESEGGEKQPYKYNDKELDSRLLLNTYDYSARYMDPAIGRFTSIDPLAEKKPWLSPYQYARNNPLRFIDPDGMDEWEINELGYVKWLRVNTESDILHLTGTGMEITVGVAGTLQHSTRDLGDGEYIDVLTVAGDETGTKLFQDLANNIDVEFGHFQTGDNEAGKNQIFTSHSRDEVRGSYGLAIENFDQGIAIRNFDHSQPNGILYPSGLIGSKEQGTGDIRTVGLIDDARKERNQANGTSMKASENRVYSPLKRSYGKAYDRNSHVNKFAPRPQKYVPY